MPGRNDLRDRVRVKDDYSLLARTFGAYPVAVPFLNMGIRGYHEEVRSDYAKPLFKAAGLGAMHYSVNDEGRVVICTDVDDVGALAARIVRS